ncbi:MAG: DNA repair protein RecN [Lachnospiraceae bacterium]|nr:DNA repair protein RecN [Lachnospiraceae bacterium]
MLLELHVKDIALIREATVEFKNGLNIMTGETGAGKSVIIGSCMLALGGKARPDIVRDGAESAYVELVFSVEKESESYFRDLGIDPEDGIIVMSRKIASGRSVSRINGETVSLKTLRDAAARLIDIYGQNEYHTLMDTENHLAILDAFLGSTVAAEKADVKAAYDRYCNAEKVLASFDLDEEKKAREIELAEYEIAEIEEAGLVPGEEEELAAEYKKLNNSRNIIEYMDRAYGALTADAAGEALSMLESAMRYDPELSGIRDELYDAQTILSDALREISSYVSSCDLSEEKLRETEKRLDLIRTLETKYGKTVDDVIGYGKKKEERLGLLRDYDENRKTAEAELAKAREELCGACGRLSEKRKEGALILCAKIRSELLELGFDSVTMELSFTEKEPQENGADRVCFLTALNPGEKAKPLSEVASGGELSRVMLSIKTVLAKTDQIPTLIFDEIDAGISGRTAQKVAEKLAIISTDHQVICITHLPQIAAMADTHYLISKEELDGRNVTGIRELSGEEPVKELSRLLGGAEITESVMENAAEMKALAERKKEEKRSSLQ